MKDRGKYNTEYTPIRINLTKLTYVKSYGDKLVTYSVLYLNENEVSL